MYLPAHFEESRPEVLHQALRDHPLGLLVTHGASGLAANPLPFLLDVEADGSQVLRGHVARANPLWREADGTASLVVFQGPQAYVSPAWYPTKAETGKVVPTWNYVMVQARGVLHAVDDTAWLQTFVSRITTRHETPRATPWAVTDAPADYIATMLRAIIGIEIRVESLAGKWKVSQNRSAADREGVAQGLAEIGGEDALAMAGLVRSPGA
jgi:transcriptional regulator